ncbi:hypothetical protein [Sandarakinorhabdus sp.]|uniref:hypothetical protein n=1 Tax=Sandarakinorhabdus sp. TaxID=1916663 RepID=UPI00286E667A|nr:hypothetical protein [Sandarakinorhabdus sp.]
METAWADVTRWFWSLGPTYGVDPVIFGVIYVGAIPFFLASIAWLVRRLRSNGSIVVPVLSSGFFFVSAYLYLAVVGRGVPIWVWGLLAALVIFGAVSTVRDVRRKVAAAKEP